MRSEQELMLWLERQFYVETFQDLQKTEYTRVEFVNISNVFIFDWFSYEFKIEMKLPVIYNSAFQEFIYACYICNYYDICQIPEKNENTGGLGISSLQTSGASMIWLGTSFWHLCGVWYTSENN